MLRRLKAELAHPLTRNLSIDDPETTIRRRRIIRQNAFLSRIYQTWYRLLIAGIPPGNAPVAEIGSGAGFIKEFYPAVITSEIFFTSNEDVVFNAMSIPLKTGSLRSLLWVDVLHHIANPNAFFTEAARCIIKGGRCLMVEPWNTAWSRWIYTHLHHEPFDVKGGWSIPDTGPLSGANGALPWILFERDRKLFTQRFPEWEIAAIRPLMPIAYLLSGGVSMRAFLPNRAYPLIRKCETFRGLEKKAAMFAMIVLEHV